MQKYISHSEDETKAIAAKLAKVSPSNIFALTGKLGAGKTIFAQGFAKGLGIKDKIISPTFVLIRQHNIPNTTKVFCHIDLYRPENFSHLGLEEILSNKNSIILIEWAEKIENILPKHTIKINITEEKSYCRLISISKGPTIC